MEEFPKMAWRQDGFQRCPKWMGLSGHGDEGQPDALWVGEVIYSLAQRYCPEDVLSLQVSTDTEDRTIPCSRRPRLVLGSLPHKQLKSGGHDKWPHQRMSSQIHGGQVRLWTAKYVACSSGIIGMSSLNV